MKKRTGLGWLAKPIALIFSLSAFGLSAATQASQNGPSAKPNITTSISVHASRPFREVAVPISKYLKEGGQAEAYPALPIPSNVGEGKGPIPQITDPVVQSDAPLDIKMPAILQSFEGNNNVTGVLPPDTVGDVGPNHYVQMVNSVVQIWDKTGTSLVGPSPINSLWTGFGGICESNNDGDPIVLYDQAADRWLLSQFALNFPNDFHQCIAVSQTGDPTGAYHLYDFLISTTKMNDYPHFGVWPDGYYMAINQFDGSTSNWAGQGVVAFERNKMLAGLPAQKVYFDDPDPNLGGMLPADWDGTTAPPAGAPNLFMQLGTTTSLDIWQFHVDWTTPANSTFTPLVSPTVAAYDSDLCGGSRNCIPQPGGTAVDTLAGRLMYRVQYRNFGTHQSMVATHTVDENGSDHAGVRWYELRDSGSGWGVVNQGTYAPDADNRWMSSAAMDAQGNIAVGYSVSSTSTYPSIRYAGRLAGDPANTLPQAEAVLIAGGGSQSHTSGRWGDYSNMSVDPVDDCTFWYTQEYYSADSSADWQTRIGSFKFPSCTAGSSGTLTGTVTSSGSPVEGVLIDAGGITTTTDAAGLYNFASIPVGTYTVTASKYGYVTGSASGVTVTDGATTVQDFSLAPAPMSTVSGTVTDGSGQGWPLYAAINIAGAPIPTLHTDPVTGAYSVSLPQGASVTINVAVDGYVSQARGITVPAGPSTEDFTMLVDEASCSAPGYAVNGLIEDFNGTFPPSGWSVVDDAGNGLVWSNVAGSGSGGNYTGGTGDAASANSDAAGSVDYDTALVSPSVNVVGDNTLTYLANYQVYSGNDFLDVDISVDGGAWTNILRWNENHGASFDLPGEQVSLDLTSYLTGASSYQLRWRYYNLVSNWDWYAQIDDVKIGGCVADSSVGGLLVGNVYDANTSNAVNAAVVSHGTHQVTSAATPDDAALDDGFYLMALPAGAAITVDATAPGYGSDSQSVTLPVGGALRQDFNLPAGQLSATPSPITMTLWEGMTWTDMLSLDNAGGNDAAYTLKEFNVPYAAPIAAGPWADVVRHMSPKHLNQASSKGIRYYNPPAPVPSAGGDVLATWPSNLTQAWGIGVDKDAGTVWVGSPYWGGGDGLDYAYSTAGTATGDSIDTASWSGGVNGPGDMAYDINGKLWQLDIGNGNCIHEMDPVTLANTGNSICPAFGTSMRGLAYDPLTDTFYAGSWNDSTIHHFDRSGTILDSKNVGLSISGLAFNPDTNHLFVVQNVPLTETEIFVLDASTTDYTVVGSFEVAFSADYGSAGLGISCDGHLWAVDQQNEAVLELDSGETSACAYKDIPWLSETPVTGTVAASSSESIDFTFDSTALTAGTYVAHVKAMNDTPYGPLPIPVEFTVIPYDQLFADVPPTHPFYNWVQSVGLAGITNGCDAQVPLPNYCESDNTTRAQMAVFLGRGIHGSSFTPPPATGTVFTDVPGTYWSAAWIEQLVADGITAGCGGGNYCPDAEVTRAEMAIFLLRSKHGASYTPPPATGTVFGDVAASDFGAAWIEELATEGITSGCGGGNYCPADPVTRGQMAVFIQRDFNLPIHP
ncbi:carboxypeptidase regulatory-like domain-containing protein [Thiolapillus brandeum]|uniref:SLH domain-containing protein n=1 Tax=Thiolapillus brandeum TaxID=1076588 RepID=A0A7U6GKW8_9GAMM|nr:carboxypeptidase regulatory-like domain-containing protein [Thiolapillus brandeum]BAO45540.1 conserved hypothetical protein [Thiolapillus brandeum]